MWMNVWNHLCLPASISALTHLAHFAAAACLDTNWWDIAALVSMYVCMGVSDALNHTKATQSTLLDSS